MKFPAGSRTECGSWYFAVSEVLGSNKVEGDIYDSTDEGKVYAYHKNYQFLCLSLLMVKPD